MSARTIPSEAELEEYTTSPPRFIALEVTMRCNMRCPMCFHGSRPHSEFVGKDMKLDVVDLLGPTLRTAEEVVLSGGGEPLMLRLLPDFIEKCHEYNPNAKVNFISNGMLLTERNARMVIEKRVHRIDFSMDGTIQYGHVGGGADHKKVEDNLRRLVRLKREYGVEEPHISIAFVAMRDNLCELAGLIELASEIGAAIHVQPVSPATEEQRNQNLFRHIAYARQVLQECAAEAQELDVDFEVRNMDLDLSQELRECLAPYQSWWVSFDGSLSPCCGGIKTGRNIYEKGLSLGELWNGPDMRRLRWELTTGYYNDTCWHCPTLWNTIENQERSITESPAEHITQLTEQVARLRTHLREVQNGRVMRLLRAIDKLIGRAE